MSQPSHSPLPIRRVPVQDRSERRVASFLAHAEAIIAEVGYEAATMTAIAARAGASIGSLYQYFPNKEALTLALFQRFGTDLELRWAALLDEADALDPEQLGATIIDRFIELADAQPAFFPIFKSPVKLKGDPAKRQRIVGYFSRIFLKKNPALSADEALQAASTTLQAVRGMVLLCGDARPKARAAIVEEHKLLLSSYLVRRLGAEMAASRHTLTAAS